MEDLLDWMLISYPLRTQKHLAGVSLYAANWLDADGVKFWLIKNTAGHPWDINTYDSNFIYRWITENGDEHAFNNSSAYKRQVVPFPFAPRLYDPTLPPVRIDTPGANPLVRTLACEADGEPIINLGPVTNITSGPVTVAFGGDVGTRLAIINSYYYGGTAREQFFFVKGLGLVQWQLSHLVSGPPITGTYTVDQTSLHNMIVNGGCPTPIFPCYLSIPGAGFGGSWIGGVPGAGGNVQNYGTIVSPPVDPDAPLLALSEITLQFDVGGDVRPGEA